MIPKINHLSDISNIYSDEDKTCSCVKTILSRINISRALGSGKGFQKGARSGMLLHMLIVMKLMKDNPSIHSMWQKKFHGLYDSGKNGFYRFLIRPQTDWRKIMAFVSIKYRQVVEQNSLSKSEDNNCFIIDDTTIEKTGKTIEGVSKVYDHTSDSLLLGYKMLVLAFFDGISTQGCDLSLHRESVKSNYGLSAKDLKKQRKGIYDSNTPMFERAKELNKTKLESGLLMLQRALKNKFKAKYILADSWFSRIEFIKGIRKISKNQVHYLGIGRKDNTRYVIKGVGWNAIQIINRYSRKFTRKNTKYNSEYFIVDCVNHDCPVKLIFIRNIGSEQWSFLLTTDMSLSFQRAYELYNIRWSIEVLFKECKQYFKLGRCQAEYLSEQIADCTIALITHTLVSLENRFANYETLGGLYTEIDTQIALMTLWQRILKLIITLMKILATIISEPIIEVVRRIIIRNHSEIKLLFQMIKTELQNDPDFDNFNPIYS